MILGDMYSDDPDVEQKGTADRNGQMNTTSCINVVGVHKHSMQKCEEVALKYLQWTCTLHTIPDLRRRSVIVIAVGVRAITVSQVNV